jgi:tellurite resistance protein
MPSQIPLTPEIAQPWIRGLLTVAWADGDFEHHEQEAIRDQACDLLAGACSQGETLTAIAPEELAAAIVDPEQRESFLKMAVIVALADGTYSPAEADLLRQYVAALDLSADLLKPLEQDCCDESGPVTSEEPHGMDVLAPVKHWLDDLKIHDPRLAHFLVKLIPPQCPFERDIVLFGHKLVHIPPMCKLNPLYEQLVGLRFRALCYLADECGEDVTPYCSADVDQL